MSKSYDTHINRLAEQLLHKSQRPGYSLPYLTTKTAEHIAEVIAKDRYIGELIEKAKGKVFVDRGLVNLAVCAIDSDYGRCVAAKFDCPDWDGTDGGCCGVDEDKVIEELQAAAGLKEEQLWPNSREKAKEMIKAAKVKEETT